MSAKATAASRLLMADGLSLAKARSIWVMDIPPIPGSRAKPTRNLI